MHHYHYTTVCRDFDNLLHSADRKLFTPMCESYHCFYSLLALIKESRRCLLETGHRCQLAICSTYTFTRAASVIRSLYNFMVVIGFYCAMPCIARTVLSQDVCLSVCLFVTRRYFVETVQHIIILFFAVEQAHQSSHAATFMPVGFRVQSSVHCYVVCLSDILSVSLVLCLMKIQH